MYQCEHFKIQELVDRETYQKRGDKAWQLLDSKLLWTIDQLREMFGPITINDWMWGGKNQSRGLRTPSSPYYSTYSMHTHGKAVDLIFSRYTAEAVRQDIKSNLSEPAFQYITSFEEGTGWLHCDVRNIERVFSFPIPITK